MSKMVLQSQVNYSVFSLKLCQFRQNLAELSGGWLRKNSRFEGTSDCIALNRLVLSCKALGFNDFVP